MRPRRLLAALLLCAPLLVVLLVVPSSSTATASTAHPTQDRCRAGRVALTFDDGPSPTATPALVRLLQRLDVPATFFMVGTRVEAHPDVARLVADAGFTVGNHTWDHTDLTGLDRRAIRREVGRTHRALLAAGVTPSPYVRPPYGAADDRVRRLLDRLGVATAFWTVDSEDWTGLTSRRITRRVVGQVESRGRRGSVVLQHDGTPTAPTMLAALPGEVRRLRRAGFCFVDLDEADPGTY
jgi:peptidoglycan/xylan/chitin deacetylase (PgdA/CDA1 family)